MNMRTGFTEGEICWTDLQTSDVAAAKAFYAAVFGWRFEDLPTPDGRSYAQAFLGEDLVSVIAPQNPHQMAAGSALRSGTCTSHPPMPASLPPAWSTPAEPLSLVRRQWAARA